MPKARKTRGSHHQTAADAHHPAGAGHNSRRGFPAPPPTEVAATALARYAQARAHADALSLALGSAPDEQRSYLEEATTAAFEQAAASERMLMGTLTCNFAQIAAKLDIALQNRLQQEDRGMTVEDLDADWLMVASVRRDIAAILIGHRTLSEPQAQG